MTQTADRITIPIIAEDRANALLHALDKLCADSAPSAPAARHAARLRFALDRLKELRLAADRDRGAFAPGRADVALSILKANIVVAAQFVAKARGMEISGRNAALASQENSEQRAENGGALERSAAERDQMVSAKARPSVSTFGKQPQPVAPADVDETALVDAQVVRTAA